MTPGEAKELSHLLARVGSQLDQSVAFVHDHDTTENFIEYRRVVGEMMGTMFLDLMTPLYARFPELRPDYLGGPYQIPGSVYLPVFMTLIPIPPLHRHRTGSDTRHCLRRTATRSHVPSRRIA